ncbi:helix-turn-helix domain-containing protein [Kiloniella antarctica]|uniref:Helix-turn-helix domain-containing protein n=1 Tax=Kiloniella antarctica TaxID=1550907 RepID=A0ABW5BKN6_9PROT
MNYPKTDSNDVRLAERLKSLRTERGWSLDELAERSTISRATLSRMEKYEVSPTASVLGRLCAAYGLTMSRLMVMVEADHQPLVKKSEQPVWRDDATGFERRSVSPPAESLSCEVLECRLLPGSEIYYPGPAKQGLEHHLILQDGGLEITFEDAVHILKPGDCLRYKLHGANTFRADEKLGARYLLIVL